MVDDSSTDEGPRQLSNLVSDDPRFWLFTNTIPRIFSGPASARNCALEKVTTRLVAFCDVDDLWHPEKLERQLNYHKKHRLDLSVCAYARFFDRETSKPLRSFICPPMTLHPGKIRGRNPIPMLTVIMASDLAKGGFLQAAHEDFLFWLQLFRSKPTLRYGCLPLVLAFYCIHKDNLSAHKAVMPIWAYRVYRQLGESILSSISALLLWMSGHLASRLLTSLDTRTSCYSIRDLLKIAPLPFAKRYSAHIDS